LISRTSLIAGLLAVMLLLGGAPSAPAQATASSRSPAQDMSHLSTEALGWLQSLLRINTTNPPGNELEAAKFIASVLEHEGIPHQIYETTPGRGFLVARLNAGAEPDPSQALLLLAHLDVVGVDKSHWTVDPFAATIRNGYLYGRGAIDDKGMVAAELATIVALKRSGARLKHDVIFLAEGDEEQGGEAGMKVAVEKYWDKIAAAYAINEGGRVIERGGKVTAVAIQASEKVPYNVDVIATGTSGHASMPLADNPVVHLAAAVAKIGMHEAPLQFNSVTRAYFDQLAQLYDEDTAKWMRALDSSDRMDHAARILSAQNPAWNSMLRDTVAPTMLQAGIRPNVIPAEARATLNIRLLPGNLLSPLLDTLGKLVNDPQVRLVPDETIGQPAPSSPVDSEFYHYLEAAARKQFPGAVALPMMSTGGTDSAPLRLRSVQAYGLLPFPMTEEDTGRMHGNDERIPVESFRQGVAFLYSLTSGFVTIE
jgi:acetylornithine deacetylase/succinyl-diaminopimelate desuccinylase-like protein